MPATFHQLLEASISYLEDLKGHGTRYVSVKPESLEGLSGLRVPIEPAPPGAAPAARLPMPAGVAEFAGAIPPTPSYEFEPALPPVHRPVRDVSEPVPVPEPAPGGAAMAAEAPASLRVEQERPVEVKEAGPKVEVLAGGGGKAEAMAALQERALVCVKCPHLANSRKNVVFGVGSIDAELMFVGEAPGADEDQAGEPFVGKAGQLLTRIIETMGLSREQVYIANILKCRPDTPGQRSGNRKPTGDEMKTCSPYLHAQVDLVRPRVLVALGATAVEGLLGAVGGITRLRGNWQTFRGTPLMPTYHPSYLLHNQAMQEKRKVWEDMLQVMETLGLRVTEKHRNYFLQR